MKEKKALMIILAVVVLLLVCAGLLYNRLSAGLERQTLVTAPPQPAETAAPAEQAAEETAEEPEPVMAPDFTVYDGEGNAVKLSDFRGKPVVLNFWASWCGPCKMEMPDFDKLWQELGDEVEFVMVNLTDGSRETVEKASAFIEEQGYGFPIYYDTDIDAAMVYGVTTIPATYLINAEGQVVGWAAGAIDEATLRGGMELFDE